MKLSRTYKTVHDDINFYILKICIYISFNDLVILHIKMINY